MPPKTRGLRSPLPRLFRLACTAAIFTLAGVAASKAEWPERALTIVVCFPAGGGTDIAVRMISNDLAEALGKPVIVENRGGAGGNIAIAAVARAEPDGYTLLGCSSAFVVNPSLYPQALYDPIKDFAPVMLIGAAPNVFVVPAASDMKSFSELIARARANPGKLNYTSSGIGTTPYLAAELIKLRLGINLVHIPFAGAGPATQAAVAGQVDMLAANLGSLGAQIRAGALRPLVQTGKERWADLPDVPTLEEVGITDAESDTFQALYAPAGVPKPVIDRLVAELRTVLGRPEMQEKYWRSGLKVLAQGPDLFHARIVREVALYKDVIDRAGLKLK